MNRKPQDLLSIGQFAQLAQLSLKALRLYEQQQILQPAFVDPDSGYRYYQLEQLPEARLIRLLRQMDMPLAQIKAIRAVPPVEAAALVNSYRQSAAAQAAIIQRLADTAIAQLTQEVIPMNLTVKEKQVGTRLILSINKQVGIKELDAYIKQSLSSLHQFIETHNGRLLGPPFGIYHGPVNAQDDGPVEVCCPVEGQFTPTGAIVMRELAAERMASVTVNGPQCDFPDILEAYNAACDWVVQQGYETAGPPREVWHTVPGPEARMEIQWPFRS